MGNISILLADDSITIQKVVGIIFATDGYTLTVVDNGKAAVDKAREINPDVLLIDAIMPGMSGYEACAEIRKDPSLSGKPVLLLTGSFEPFDEQKAKESGADDHIVKPFESQQLVAKVKELYELARNRPAPAAVVQEPVVPAPAEIPQEEPTVNFMEPETLAFETPAAVVAAAELPQPEISPDDPWGAYTAVLSETGETKTEAIFEKPDTSIEPPQFQPDVMEIMSQESLTPAAPETDLSGIGSSWIPTEEQTFEFTDEIADIPTTVIAQAAAEDEIPEPEPVFNPMEFEPIAAVEPVAEQVAEVPPDVEPPQVVPEQSAVIAAPVAAPVALTDEQLKEALLSASRETIERIVWEVVPDLAEAMIKEAIRRITEGK